MDKVAYAAELAEEVLKFWLVDKTPEHSWSDYDMARDYAESEILMSVRGREPFNYHEVVGPEGRTVPTFGTGGPLDWCQIYDDKKSARTIARATTGDPLARDVLLHIASRFVAYGHPLPPRLRVYTAKVLQALAEQSSANPRRGPTPWAKHRRDYALAAAVHEVVIQDGFGAYAKPCRQN